MFGNFEEEARKILVGAKEEMRNLKHPYVGSEHLLLSILKQDNAIRDKLKEYQITYSIVKEEIVKIIGVGSKESEWFLYTPLLKRVLEQAVIDSKENNQGVVTTFHLFSSLLEEGEGVAIRILIGMDVDMDELYHEFSYKLNQTKKKSNHKKLLIEELGVDLTRKAQNGELDPVIGRDDELKRVMEILTRKNKNNPILVGLAGVGKTAIVEELSARIVRGEVPIALKNKRIISLDMATTVAGTKYRGEFEERMHKILKEIEENDDIILFIDEIHTLVGAGGAEGAIDASNIFKPALARGTLRCIGATTTEEYKKFIENDSALERRFQKVYVEEPNREKTKHILEKLRPIYEKYHCVTIPDTCLDEIIKLSDEYIYDRFEPDKSIDVLDEVCSRVKLKESKEVRDYNETHKKLQSVIEEKKEAIVSQDFKKASRLKTEENRYMDALNELELKLYKKEKKIVTKEDLADVIHNKTKIPVYEIMKESKKTVEELEKKLKNRILGEEEAVSKLIQIARKLKLGFQTENKAHSILFCGSTGVGKTCLAKSFGEVLVGRENVIKLDMSEYSESHSVSKLVGAPPGYVGYMDNQNVFEEIRNHPHSVLILDEIEKAHPDVLNLFLQILEEHKIKDARGHIIRFDHTIILMTSNVGFHEIHVGFHKETKETIQTRLKEHFQMPFLNRIDEVVLFEPLTESVMRTLIQKELEELVSRYEKQGIQVAYTKEIEDEILRKTEYTEYGARKLSKIVNDYCENQIIDEILNEKKEIQLKI
ncbi:MAG: ATP-dependent Clp protease ATP-binding subunit [Firmicutes bacterium]|nr:ATP-dependent Clp protease ATP-binding subunit [Bacillota bacterium]